MNWREHIHADSAILTGKPIVKGTRLSVEFIVGRLANGWTEEEILENYAGLTKENLQAVYAFTYELLQDSLLYPPANRQAA
ncbi:MAG: DUF433 domain-containing protein [Bacteroidota bacterium]